MKRHRKIHPRAYALVIVLFGIVICATMIVLLMERGSVDLKSASSYSQGGRVRVLSDMVQSVVQAQIKDATTLNQQLSTAIDARDTWASQPGAIRVYSPTGALRRFYKLYSAEEMSSTSANFAGDIPTSWASSPLLYTDLNEPVGEDTGSATLLHYPILDPALAQPATATALLPGATGILNGFSITGAPVATGASANAAPMPVRWIYVLQDGTHCQLGDSRIDKANNPIIGRIAFWTDDETAKVNINTASPVTANSAWDIPRARSNWERDAYAYGQPSQNEYQRYPGHPAMVSLRPILGTLGNMSPSDYFQLTPRYYWGGSQDGAIAVNVARQSLLVLKEDRTYANVDELLFRSLPLSAGGSTLRAAPSDAQVSALQFFLSANSRAPELNLYGQPRVTIWPVFGNPDAADPGDHRRTAYDRLIAYNSTIGGKPYYFTREQPLSPTHDYASIPRNQALYAYLQEMTSHPVPGTTGTHSFLSKYTADRDQILTSIFDYIRVVNLNETYSGKGSGFVSYTPDATAISDQDGSYSETSPHKGAGLVVPIQIGDTRGGGRFPAIMGVGLWFVRHVDGKIPAGEIKPDTPEKLDALLTVRTCTPMHGFMPWIGSDLNFEIVNSNIEVQIEDEPPVSLFSGGISKQVYYAPNSSYAVGNSPGGFEGAAWPLGKNSKEAKANTVFMSSMISIPAGLTGGKFSILGGSVDLRIRVHGVVIQSYRVTFPAVTGLDLPTPRHSVDSLVGFGKERRWWASRLWHGPFSPFPGDGFRSVELAHGDARLALMTATTEETPFENYLAHPDFTDSGTAFAHSFRGYHDGKPYRWHGGTGGSYVGGLTYSTTTAYAEGHPSIGRAMFADFRPEIHPDITDLRAHWSGDFDNGVFGFSDGPYLNKSDEGMIAFHAHHPPYNLTSWTPANGLFSPLRQVPSAVVFGSLPTGVKTNTPWQTLLFNPTPADPAHFGFRAPADYLLLDLFRMPVVEPYAISSPAATDGKINMNYAIAPFSYIRRASSWYSLLEPIKIFSIPDSAASSYKSGVGAGAATRNYRSGIDVAATLAQFDTRFASGDIFRSAAEICSIFLVPQGQTLASTSNLTTGYWSAHRLTGDNSRERPYAELYPKLTTQSNTYRVHLRVQLLPPSGGPPSGGGDFTPLAEYRGSRLIERYLDANDPAFATVDPDQSNLNALYRFRVLETRQFSP